MSYDASFLLILPERKNMCLKVPVSVCKVFNFRITWLLVNWTTSFEGRRRMLTPFLNFLSISNQVETFFARLALTRHLFSRNICYMKCCWKSYPQTSFCYSHRGEEFEWIPFVIFSWCVKEALEEGPMMLFATDRIKKKHISFHGINVVFFITCWLLLKFRNSSFRYPSWLGSILWFELNFILFSVNEVEYFVVSYPKERERERERDG